MPASTNNSDNSIKYHSATHELTPENTTGFPHKTYFTKVENTVNGIKRTTIVLSKTENKFSQIYCASSSPINKPQDMFPIKTKVNYSMISPVAKKVTTEQPKKFKKSTQTSIMSFFNKV